MNRLHQRGAATLLIVLILLGAMLLVLLAANRGLLLELRMSANQVEASAAFEAAEAGIEWAAALLNAPDRLGPDCRAAADGTTSFRERHLRFDGSAIVARSWDRAGVPAPLQPACVPTPAGWSCSCPASGAAVLPDGDAAGFVLQFLAGTRPGTLQLVATGRSTIAAANASHRVVFALQPALPVPPPTALTPANDDNFLIIARATDCTKAGSWLSGMKRPEAKDSGRYTRLATAGAELGPQR